MYGAFFKVVAKPWKKRELVDFLRWDAEIAKAAEPGTLRFDVWDVHSDNELSSSARPGGEVLPTYRKAAPSPPVPSC